MSGLKINIEKTKACWIGSMKNAQNKLCEDVALDWTNDPLKILGVYFTPDVSKVWEINEVEIFNKCEHTLNSWSKRSLTLFGKVTIIKSLILSKFIHIFISLQNPPLVFFKRLEKNSILFSMEQWTRQN
jgi:hypothetical protein